MIERLSTWLFFGRSHLIIQVMGSSDGQLPAHRVQDDSAQALGLLHSGCQVAQGLLVVLDGTPLAAQRPFSSIS